MAGFVLLLALTFVWTVHTMEDFTLNMNCTAQSLYGSDCQNYMRDFLSNYILQDKMYNPQTLPVKNPYWHIKPPDAGAVYQAVSVKMAMTLQNLVAVDTASGTMTTAVFLGAYWKDQLLSWDPQWTDGYNFLTVDPSLIWRPDLQLYNVVGSLEDQVISPNLFLSSDGTVQWDTNGLITFSCTYDTSNFPFDKQRCSAVFGSWIYAAYQMNISEAAVRVTSTFSNIAWEVTSVEASTMEQVQWQVYPYSFAVFSVGVDRYYNHDVSTAIVPSLVVTYLVLLALFVHHIPDRLGVAVTGLLALIAVQWTVSSELPVSAKETWLGQLSDLCVCFITLVCIEGFAVGYLRHRHTAESPAGQSIALPPWARYIVGASGALHRTRRRALDALLACCRTARGQPLGTASAASPSVESRDNKLAGDESLGQQNGARYVHSCASGVVTKGANGTGKACGDQGVGTAGQNSWEGVADALDNVARTVLPATFTIVLIAYLADASA